MQEICFKKNNALYINGTGINDIYKKIYDEDLIGLNKDFFTSDYDLYCYDTNLKYIVKCYRKEDTYLEFKNKVKEELNINTDDYFCVKCYEPLDFLMFIANLEHGYDPNELKILVDYLTYSFECSFDCSVIEKYLGSYEEDEFVLTLVVEFQGEIVDKTLNVSRQFIEDIKERFIDKFDITSYEYNSEIRNSILLEMIEQCYLDLNESEE